MSALVAGLTGVAIILGMLQDAFEVVLLPRRVHRRWRVVRAFFVPTWAIWSSIGARIPSGPRREAFLAVYGPGAMVLLFGLWAVGLITGFGLVHWALDAAWAGGGRLSLAGAMFLSGDAFLTLGYGDVVPPAFGLRMLALAEAFTGFGFIALTISYLPVLYQHFSERDVQLIQLEARVGAPASCAAMLVVFAGEASAAPVEAWLREWELWAAKLVESHASYPMLAFYRSQHREQSWLATLAVILDCCTLMLAHADASPMQTGATFAAARRVVVEVCGSLALDPDVVATEARFPSRQQREALARTLAATSLAWREVGSEETTARLRATYEPCLAALSAYLMLPLPAWRDTASPPTDPRSAVLERLLLKP